MCVCMCPEPGDAEFDNYLGVIEQFGQTVSYQVGKYHMTSINLRGSLTFPSKYKI